MCCQLYPTMATPPFILPCPFLHLSAQLPGHHPVFQPCPFSPCSRMLLPSPGSDSEEFRTFPFPAVTRVFSYPSFLAQSQQGSTHFTWFITTFPEVSWAASSRMILCLFYPSEPYTCSSLLTSLIPCEHLSAPKHQMLFPAALVAQLRLQGLAFGLGWDELSPGTDPGGFSFWAGLGVAA